MPEISRLSPVFDALQGVAFHFYGDPLTVFFNLAWVIGKTRTVRERPFDFLWGGGGGRKIF